MSTSTKATARVLSLVALLIVAATAPASAVSVKTYEKQVIEATNAYRVSHGKAQVKFQKCVDRWANGQAAWMAKHQKMQHRSGRLKKIIKDCHLTGSSENIAWNYPSGTRVVDAWSRSSGHAKNMRATKMRYIGVGVARARNGDIYVSEVFGTRK